MQTPEHCCPAEVTHQTLRSLQAELSLWLSTCAEAHHTTDVHWLTTAKTTALLVTNTLDFVVNYHEKNLCKNQKELYLSLLHHREVFHQLVTRKLQFTS